MKSPLWKQHFSIEQKASDNWKMHFWNYEDLQLFDEKTKQVLQAITRILSAQEGMYDSNWDWLHAAMVEHEWLFMFLDGRESHVAVFKNGQRNPDNYRTWDEDGQTWVEMKGIRVQLNDLIHDTKKVLREINELRWTEYVHRDDELTTAGRALAPMSDLLFKLKGLC